MSMSRFCKLSTTTVSALLLVVFLRAAAAEETNAAAPDLAGQVADSSSSNDTLRAYLQLQEQLHETQLAIERVRRQSEDAAARSAEALTNQLRANTEALNNQLRAVEQTLLDQRARDSHFMLIVLSVFASISFLAVVITAYFQWRTVNRLADFSAVLPSIRSLGPTPTVAALGPGDQRLVSVGAAEQSSNRLLSALERLEKRIAELEQLANAPLNGRAIESNGGVVEPEKLPPQPMAPVSTPVAEVGGADKATQVKALLDQGQSLLNEEKAERAVAFFDEALTLDPNSAEALVKKGLALEKVRKLQEAIECYDRAIALDGAMTIAYLYKGGLYNRMERFGEAVECYEQALRTQEKRAEA